jgi:hypothetical protein
MELDQGSKLSKEERQSIWQVAHRKTVQRLVMLHLWPHDVPVPDLQKFYEQESK